MRYSIKDFIIGESYHVEIKDKKYPLFEQVNGQYVETGEQEVKGGARKFTVLNHLAGLRQDFIEVFDLEKGFCRLLYVPNIEKAKMLCN